MHEYILVCYIKAIEHANASIPTVFPNYAIAAANCQPLDSASFAGYLPFAGKKVPGAGKGISLIPFEKPALVHLNVLKHRRIFRQKVTQKNFFDAGSTFLDAGASNTVKDLIGGGRYGAPGLYSHTGRRARYAAPKAAVCPAARKRTAPAPAERSGAPDQEQDFSAPVPESLPVEDSYFEDALFIGDSPVKTSRLSRRLEQAL